MRPDDPASSFTFLHAADLHLDSPLRGLSSYPGAPADRLREATRDAFVSLVDQALQADVRFVLLCGDLFDGDWQDFNSGLWFQTQLRRFSARSIPVFVIRGNHDAEGKVTKSLAWPELVTEFPSKKPKTHRLDELGVALHGQSYGVAHVEENLALGYPDPVPGHLNIGLLHTGLEGYEGHGHYAPCTADDLVAKGYDYWALGHIHKREVVRENPWVVFPGNIQGRHVRETGPKGATLVRVEDGKVAAVEELECDVARWALVEVDLTGCAEEALALGLMEDALRSAEKGSGDRLLAARVAVRGATGLDALLRTEHHRLTQEVRARASGISEEIWIEKLEVRTSPGGSLDATGPSADERLTAFAGRLREETLSKGDLDALGRELQRLSAKLPPAVRGAVDPGSPEHLGSALLDARKYLSALLVVDEHDLKPGLKGVKDADA